MTAYSRNTGEDKPAPELARKALDELLQNIRLENCVFFPDVVNALFRRAPGTVEAENYGHEGLNVSYFVKNNSTKSKYYRTLEPVQIEPIERSGQAIQLNAQEWTAYTVNSLAAKTCALTVKARAESAPAVFQIYVNGSSQEIAVADKDWTEIKPQAGQPFIRRQSGQACRQERLCWSGLDEIFMIRNYE